MTQVNKDLPLLLVRKKITKWPKIDAVKRKTSNTFTLAWTFIHAHSNAQITQTKHHFKGVIVCSEMIQSLFTQVLNSL